MNCWVLTEEYNQYDQYGQYFLAVFKNEPTVKCIKKWAKNNGIVLSEEDANHIVSGGGRRYPEHQWYYLDKVEMQGFDNV